MPEGRRSARHQDTSRSDSLWVGEARSNSRLVGTSLELEVDEWLAETILYRDGDNAAKTPSFHALALTCDCSLLDSLTAGNPFGY